MPSSTSATSADPPFHTGTPEDAAQRRIDLSGKVDVLLSRGPVGDRDPHRTATLPDRATHPARPVALDRRDDRRSALVGPVVVVGGRSEADEDLIENDVIEDRDPGRGGEPLRDPAGERAASVYELGDAGSTERAKRGVDAEASGVAG